MAQARSDQVAPRHPSPQGQEGGVRALVITVIVIGLFLYAVRVILLPFVIAAIAAYICNPFVNALARRTRLPRPLFAVAAFIVLVAAVGLLMLAVAPSRTSSTPGSATARSSCSGIP
jgi:predicted PurR-regulated permease PerM